MCCLSRCRRFPPLCISVHFVSFPLEYSIKIELKNTIFFVLCLLLVMCYFISVAHFFCCALFFCIILSHLWMYFFRCSLPATVVSPKPLSSPCVNVFLPSASSLNQAHWIFTRRSYIEHDWMFSIPNANAIRWSRFFLHSLLLLLLLLCQFDSTTAHWTFCFFFFTLLLTNVR